MKHLFFFIFNFLLISQIFCQDKLPNIILKDISGNSVNLSEISNGGNPIVINFWSTWCAPCKRELNSINEQFNDWVDETGVKLYAISIDDQRTVDRVKPYVNANDWQFEILLDTNGDLKRAMGVNSIPFTILLNSDCQIVWRHNNYNPGDEEELYLKIIELNEKK